MYLRVYQSITTAPKKGRVLCQIRDASATEHTAAEYSGMYKRSKKHVLVYICSHTSCLIMFLIFVLLFYCFISMVAFSAGEFIFLS